MNIKSSNKELKAVLLIFSIVFCNLLFINNNEVSAYDDTIVLYDGEYSYFKTEIVVGGALEFFQWSFSGSKSDVGVTVLLMNEENFLIWGTILVLIFGQAEGFTLSNGNHAKDSGLHSIPSEDTWYVVFYVDDSDAMFSPTTISLTVNYIQSWIGFTILAAIILVVVITIMIIVLVVSKKRRKKAQLQQSQPFLQSTQPVIYCINCGFVNPHNASFCQKCGTKIQHGNKA